MGLGIWRPQPPASLYNSEIRVPLVIAGPGIRPRRIQRTVGLHDLAPTLLDLAGFVPPGMPAMDGASVAPVLFGTAPDQGGEAYAAMVEDRSVSTAQRALVVGNYKIIQRDQALPQAHDIRRPAQARSLASQPGLATPSGASWRRANSRRRIPSDGPARPSRSLGGGAGHRVDRLRPTYAG